MAEDPVRDGKKFDPMEPWRGVRDVYMDAWGKTMVDMVNSEAYAQATGAVLDTYLTVSAPFREAIEKAMLKTLEQLAMPTRADVVSIAERMTNIEMRLDDLDAKLDSIQRLITHAGAASRPAQRTSPQPSRPQPPKKKTTSAKKVIAKKAVKRGKK
jgi:polyhydroxyalkanoic acid synthase PhaR subunit